jgi:hypothetical protein
MSERFRLGLFSPDVLPDEEWEAKLKGMGVEQGLIDAAMAQPPETRLFFVQERLLEIDPDFQESVRPYRNGEFVDTPIDPEGMSADLMDAVRNPREWPGSTEDPQQES